LEDLADVQHREVGGIPLHIRVQEVCAEWAAREEVLECLTQLSTSCSGIAPQYRRSRATRDT